MQGHASCEKADNIPSKIICKRKALLAFCSLHSCLDKYNFSERVTSYKGPHPETISSQHSPASRLNILLDAPEHQ